MPSPNDLEGTIKKELRIFYLLDVSASMNGNPIAALNDAMRSTVKALKDKFDGNPDAVLKIGVITYSNGAEWITLGATHTENIDYYVWEDVKAAGMTYLGAGLDLLREGLSRNTSMKSDTGNKTPVIIIMTDGYPTDNWKEALSKIRENKWFQHALKIGIALGDNADTSVLTEVVGSNEGVIEAQDLDKFADMIRIVSVVSALQGSQSQVSPPSQKQIIDETKNIEKEEKNPPPVDEFDEDIE